MKRMLRRYPLLLRLVLAIAICLLAVTPALSAELLQNMLSSMQESQQWWDNLWQQTFDPANSISANISTYTFTTAVRTALGIAVIFWIFQYGQRMTESRGMAQAIVTNMQFFLPVFLVVIFLSHQGQYSRVLAYGLRDVINSWSNGVMSLNIAGHNVRAALSDQLVTRDAKNAIEAQARQCMQMPHPDVALPSVTQPAPDPNHPLTKQQQDAYAYLACIQSLGNFAQKTQDDALASNPCVVLSGGACGFARQALSLMVDTISSIFQSEQQKYTSTNVTGVGTVSQKTWSDLLSDAELTAGYGPILNFTQWMWTNLLEMALWLSALFAPMFIAFSMIPGRQNMFVGWLVEFLTIGFAKLAYVIVIGIVAVQLSDQALPPDADIRFPMALGLFAPGVSLAVVTAGGFMAASSFRNQSIAQVTIVSTAVMNTVGTLGYSLSRFADRNR